MDDQIEKQIIRQISEHLGIEKEEISPQSNLFEDFNTSKLEIVDLMNDLQSIYKIHIQDEDIENIQTVIDIINLIKDQLDEF